jgi:hypothetical protein
MTIHERAKAIFRIVTNRRLTYTDQVELVEAELRAIERASEKAIDDAHTQWRLMNE